jgi:hypothetical protein
MGEGRSILPAPPRRALDHRPCGGVRIPHAEHGLPGVGRHDRAPRVGSVFTPDL